ncbi:thiamine-phosphate kinase [Kistimonas asteriae]|uniref:thiamine-phosphate kinase n=1 Tax=Kistimonas asteriae TaxID=517724 RepID=UPI001BA54B18|nr:thiamine-phosphate kinase [Kistimonas asteriae]
MNEFDLIARYFNQPALTGQPGCEGCVVVGIGDDCAVVSVPDGWQLVQSIDTLVEGVHFPAGIDPVLLGWRALAVSVSDLAAMGARPHSFFLALTLPKVDTDWLAGFSQGMADLAARCGIPLVGGDTTRGSMAISLHVQGVVSADSALKRNGARPGDTVYVSGTLGDAGGALPLVLQGAGIGDGKNASETALLARYYRPQPRLMLGQWLVEKGATAAIDISDGLLGDLSHILRASGCGATLNSDALPLSDALRAVYSEDQARSLALTAGDDYELCFTAPASAITESESPIPIVAIGTIVEQSGIRLDGQFVDSSDGGFRHFS